MVPLCIIASISHAPTLWNKKHNATMAAATAAPVAAAASTECKVRMAALWLELANFVQNYVAFSLPNRLRYDLIYKNEDHFWI